MKSFLLLALTSLVGPLPVSTSSSEPSRSQFQLRRGAQEKSSSAIIQEIFQGTIVTDSSVIPAYALACYGGGADDACNGCGGVLITTMHVLTAAHCAGPGLTSPPTGVRLGTITNDGGTYVDVVEVATHPDYVETTLLNDVMVLTLATEITTITPIAFNRNTAYPDGTSTVAVTAFGFGGIDAASTQSDVLRTANTEIQTDASCEAAWSIYSSALQVCATNANEGICQGDSGGPLVDGSNVVVGLLSYGTQACADGTNDVWYDPSAYAAWIDEQTNTSPAPTEAPTAPDATPAPTAPDATPAPTTPGTTPSPTTTGASTPAPSASPTVAESCFIDKVIDCARNVYGFVLSLAFLCS